MTSGASPYPGAPEVFCLSAEAFMRYPRLILLIAFVLSIPLAAGCLKEEPKEAPMPPNLKSIPQIPKKGGKPSKQIPQPDQEQDQ